MSYRDVLNLFGTSSVKRAIVHCTTTLLTLHRNQNYWKFIDNIPGIIWVVPHAISKLTLRGADQLPINFDELGLT